MFFMLDVVTGVGPVSMIITSNKANNNTLAHYHPFGTEKTERYDPELEL